MAHGCNLQGSKIESIEPFKNKTSGKVVRIREVPSSWVNNEQNLNEFKKIPLVSFNCSF